MPSVESRDNGICVGIRGEGCSRGVYVKDRCEKHYRAWLRHGRPDVARSEDDAFNRAVQAFSAWSDVSDDARERDLEEKKETLRAAFKELAQVWHLKPMPRRFTEPVADALAKMTREQRQETVIKAYEDLPILDRRNLGKRLMKLTADERRARARAGAQKRMAKFGKAYIRKLAAAGAATRWGKRSAAANEG